MSATKSAESAEALAAIEQLLEDLNAVDDNPSVSSHGDDGSSFVDGDDRRASMRRLSEGSLERVASIFARIGNASVKGSIRIHNGTGHGQEDTKVIMIDAETTTSEVVLLVLAKFNDASLRQLNPEDCTLHWVSGGLTDKELTEDEHPLEYRQRLPPDAIVLDRDRYYLRTSVIDLTTGEIPVQFTGRWHTAGLLTIPLTALTFTNQTIAIALQAAAIFNDIGEVALVVLSGKEERVLGMWDQPLLVQKAYDGKAFFRICPKADLATTATPAASLSPVALQPEQDEFRSRSRSVLASGMKSIINETAKDFRRRTASLGEAFSGNIGKKRDSKDGKALSKKATGKSGSETDHLTPLMDIPGSPALERSAKGVVFGAPLDKGVLDSRGVPVLVSACVAVLEEGGHLNEEGIYRVSAAAGRLAELRRLIESNPSNPGSQIVASECPNVITNILKSYLRELPDHILTDPLKPHFAVVASIADDTSRNDAMRKMVLQLPTVNRRLLGALFTHLQRVLQREVENKMPLKNLGIVFCPTLQIPARLFCIMMEGNEALFAEP